FPEQDPTTLDAPVSKGAVPRTEGQMREEINRIVTDSLRNYFSNLNLNRPNNGNIERRLGADNGVISGQERARISNDLVQMQKPYLHR
ncbi:unnamed protein product, partial [Ceratitis capitata]